MKKTEWDYGYETADVDENRELVDIEEMLSGAVDIPTEDYLTMVRDGIEYPDAREYWEGYNARVEEDLEPDYGGDNKAWQKNYSLLTYEEREELESRITGGEVESLTKERRDRVDLILQETGRRVTGEYVWESEDWIRFDVEPETLTRFTFRASWEGSDLTATQTVEAGTYEYALEILYGMSGEWFFDQGGSGDMGSPGNVELIKEMKI